VEYGAKINIKKKTIRLGLPPIILTFKKKKKKKKGFYNNCSVSW